MLEANVSLQILDLNRNEGITDGHIALPVMLRMNQLLQGGETPTELELQNVSSDCRYIVSAVTKMMRVSDSFQTLKLQNVTCDCRYIVSAVAKVMQVSDSFQTLNLGYSKIDVDGITTVAKAVQNAALTTLILDGNEVTDEGAGLLKGALKFNQSVQNLR